MRKSSEGAFVWETEKDRQNGFNVDSYRRAARSASRDARVEMASACISAHLLLHLPRLVPPARTHTRGRRIEFFPSCECNLCTYHVASNRIKCSLKSSSSGTYRMKYVRHIWALEEPPHSTRASAARLSPESNGRDTAKEQKKEDHFIEVNSVLPGVSGAYVCGPENACRRQSALALPDSHSPFSRDS